MILTRPTATRLFSASCSGEAKKRNFSFDYRKLKGLKLLRLYLVSVSVGVEIQGVKLFSILNFEF